LRSNASLPCKLQAAQATFLQQHDLCQRIVATCAGVVCEKASIDESYLDVTAAAKHRLTTRGAPWLSAADNLDQIRVGLQARFQTAFGQPDRQAAVQKLQG
jgi:hypothetical protein